ncbi:MAG: rhodanese-like domain-containing protein [Sandaracinaceae bacterium]|nr:rhodanese-like domain-containing protein [Sandaracinaceae bacterium]
MRGRISGEDARRLLAEGALLLDVRTPAEFAAGHLDGARNIPLGELASRAGELGDAGRDVVVYCASGMRSRSAQGLLRRRGFTKVHDLGGMYRY